MGAHVTREELVVAVLTSAAGQPLDAALDVATALLAAWAALATAVAVVTWLLCRRPEGAPS